MMQGYHKTVKLMAFAISVGLLSSANLSSAASSSALKDQNQLYESDILIIDHTPGTKQNTDKTQRSDTLSAGPIVINSIEEDIGDIERAQSTTTTTSVSTTDAASDRNRYESPQAMVVEKSQKDQIDASSSKSGSTNEKPESRNQADTGSNDSSAQVIDAVVLDHRPMSDSSDYPVTRSPASSTTSTTQSALMNINNNNNYVTPLPVSYATSSPVTPASGWSIQIPQQSQQPANMQSQQARNGGQYLTSSSNQMSVVSQAHPASINAIIAEQNGGASNMGLHTQAGNQMNGNNIQQQQQQQSVPISINGQPASLVFLNGASNGNGSPMVASPTTTASATTTQTTLTGRGRASISGLLRGLGSMLANLFNRREHGPLSSGQLLASGSAQASSSVVPQVVAMPSTVNGATGSQPSTSTSNSGGGWLQLGPNAPHWLTQAQSAIQSLQQTQQQLLSSAASGLSAAASQNRYQIVAAPSTTTSVGQQQKPATTLAITLPQNFAQQMAAQPQQQQQTVASSASSSDLQMSGSQPQYTIVHSTGNAINGPPQQQTGSTGVQQQQQLANGQLSSSSSSQAIQSADKHQNGPASSSQQPSRFGRSSSRQQQIPAANSQQNLPLAHYSQYAAQLSSD